MHLRKLKLVVIGAVAVCGVTASLAIRYRAQTKLHEREEMLRQQDGQLTELAAEHLHLSNLVAQAGRSPTGNPALDDQKAELVKLRSEAETFRKQINELAKQQADNRRTGPLPNAPSPLIGSSDGSKVEFNLTSGEDKNVLLEAYKKELGQAAPHSWADAQNLARAIRMYADKHEGELPSNFDQAASYFIKEYRPPQTSEFEMVYLGSLNELTNVPAQAVALIRERQAWPTPAGKLARIYVMAGESVKFVESDDNFQSWEAEHIIPPPSP